MDAGQALVDKILNGGFLTREQQVSEYEQYFESQYNYETRQYEPKKVMPNNLIIFWSRYTYEDYDGDGEVWGFNTDNQLFFNVSGSHCSCYGLEGQWEEEYYTYDEMVAVLERVINPTYVYDQDKLNDLIELLKTIKGE